MAFTSNNKKQSLKKYDKIYDLFVKFPSKLFLGNDFLLMYNSLYSDQVTQGNLSMELNRIWKDRKIIRTPTQTTKGFIYSLNNQGGLDEAYAHYLVPYEFDNAFRLRELMLLKTFEPLKTTSSLCLNKIEGRRFFKKYGKTHFNKIRTQQFFAKLVGFVMGGWPFVC